MSTNKGRARLALQTCVSRTGPGRKGSHRAMRLQSGESVRASKHGSVQRVEELTRCVAGIAYAIKEGRGDERTHANDGEAGGNEQANGRGQCTHSEPLARIEAEDEVADGIQAFSNPRQNPTAKVAHGSLLDVEWLLDLLPPVDDDGAHMWLDEPQHQEVEDDVGEGHGSGLHELLGLAVSLGDPGNAFRGEPRLHESVAVGFSGLDREIAGVLVLISGEPIGALLKDDLLVGEVGDELALTDTEKLGDLAEALGGLRLNEPVNEFDSRLLGLNQGLLLLDALSLISGKAQGLSERLGRGDSLSRLTRLRFLLGLKFLPAVDDPGANLVAIPGDNQIHITLDKVVHRDGATARLLNSAFTIRSQKPLIEQTINRCNDIVMSRGSKISDLATGHRYGFSGLDDGQHSGLHFRGALAGLGLEQVGQEQVRPIKLDRCRNAALQPVGHALDTTRLVIIEKLSDPRGATKCVNELFVVHAHIKHRVDFIVNTMFSTVRLLVQHARHEERQAHA